MDRSEMTSLVNDKDKQAQEFISDIYSGWGAQMGASKIQISVGLTKPGEKKPIKLRFNGQKTTPTHVIPGCACSNVWEIKFKEDEDWGKVFAFISELSVPTLEDLKASQDVQNGAKKVARSFDFEVFFKESENEKFIFSTDGYARYNPMCFTSKIQVDYIIDLN